MLHNTITEDIHMTFENNSRFSEPLVHPDPEGPERIMNEIVTILADLPTVHSIGVFGSLARKNSDRWSDIDMLVGCENLHSTEWQAADAIRSAKSVLYYRKFSLLEPPSGRYWFDSESPFHRIDISFHTVEEFQSYLIEPVRYGHDLTLREVYRSNATLPFVDSLINEYHRRVIDPAEQETGLWIYRLIERTKAHMRGGRTIEDLISTGDTLRNHLSNLSPEVVIVGGDIHSLAQRVLDISDQLILLAGIIEPFRAEF